MLLILLISLACKLPLEPSLTFEEEVATKAAIALTGTAESQQGQPLTDQTVSPPTITAKPDQESATFTPTVSTEDPKLNLGQPDWIDTLTTGNSFGLDPGGTTTYYTLIKVENGKLVMTRDTALVGKTWQLAYPRPKDFYLEAKFENGTCSGDDQYGLVFRADNYTDSFAYYFIITCDGHYDLLKQTTSGSALLLNWKTSDEIHKGSNQTNILGIWADGSIIRMYANGKLLKEINDDSLLNDGHIGLFIDAKKTAGFTIKMDEISYWNLP